MNNEIYIKNLERNLLKNTIDGLEYKINFFEKEMKIFKSIISNQEEKINTLKQNSGYNNNTTNNINNNNIMYVSFGKEDINALNL